MTIVAFLQNMWVRDPERVRRTLERDRAQHGEEYATEVRRRFQHFALFAGCLTGRRLNKAFGEGLCEEIIWEEASLVITGDSKTIPPPDTAHIARTLEELKPDVVLTFGDYAHKHVSPLWRGVLIKCPHPAARQADIPDRLKECAQALQQAMTPLVL